jgi:hypothetical protein
MSRELEIYATAREKGFSSFALSRQSHPLVSDGALFVWRGTHNGSEYGGLCSTVVLPGEAEAYELCLGSAIDFLSSFEG